MAPPSPSLELAGGTHVGRFRKRNEDSFLICRLGKSPTLLKSSLPSTPQGWAEGSLRDAAGGGRDGAPSVGGGLHPARSVDPGGAGMDELLVLAVADGVGGGPGGDVASQLAVRLFPEFLAARLRADGNTSLTPDHLSEAVLAAHDRVVHSGGPDSPHAGMATTLTAWVSGGDGAWLVQVGDSRCYRLRDGELTRLSADQTLAQDLLDDGTISDLNAVADIYHNTLTSTVGGHTSRPVVTRLDRAPGDVVLICSDGITKHVDDERLAHLLQAPMSVAETLSVIFEAVLEDGATDNLTAIIARETE